MRQYCWPSPVKGGKKNDAGHRQQRRGLGRPKKNTQESAGGSRGDCGVAKRNGGRW